VVGNPGHPVRVDGVRPEGPDADWVHLPDPVADAIKDLSRRIGALEKRTAGGEEGEVRPLRPVRGPNPAGG
jgi:serine O-acetyltransferase